MREEDKEESGLNSHDTTFPQRRVKSNKHLVCEYLRYVCGKQ